MSTYLFTKVYQRTSVDYKKITLYRKLDGEFVEVDIDFVNQDYDFMDTILQSDYFHRGLVPNASQNIEEEFKESGCFDPCWITWDALQILGRYDNQYKHLIQNVEVYLEGNNMYYPEEIYVQLWMG